MTVETIHEICSTACWVSLMATILIYHWISCKYGGDENEGDDKNA